MTSKGNSSSSRKKGPEESDNAELDRVNRELAWAINLGARYEQLHVPDIYRVAITSGLTEPRLSPPGSHSDNYVLVTEELLYAYARLVGSLDYRIRGDITYFTAPNNGAVFSTGSIAFGQALPAKAFFRTPRLACSFALATLSGWGLVR